MSDNPRWEIIQGDALKLLGDFSPISPFPLIFSIKRASDGIRRSGSQAHAASIAQMYILRSL